VNYVFLPLFIILGLLVLFAILAVLARLRGGRYLRPLVAGLARIGFIRRFFERSSRAAIEKTQPELASALRKLERLGPKPDPQKAAQAIHQLTPAEREAYMSLAEQQGGIPEPPNRQARRLQQRQQAARPPASAKKPGKKRR
jgi:hypothetical protein